VVDVGVCGVEYVFEFVVYDDHVVFVGEVVGGDGGECDDGRWVPRFGFWYFEWVCCFFCVEWVGVVVG